MSFEVAMLFGLAMLASGAIACVVYYVRRFEPPRPSGFRYFAIAAVVTVVGYLAGSFTGIGVACAASSGNLCGIWGALVSGPIVAGLALWLYGPIRRRQAGR
jgi:hypothetical protein